MAQLRLHGKGDIKTTYFEENKSLLHILQEMGVEISAPCGGNGSCGKCKVKILNVGIVHSCTYYPDDDIEVVLPNQREVQILRHQFEHSLHLNLQPNRLAQDAKNPIGLAIDIGTTSVVFYWINLTSGEIISSTGVNNPQTRYGADVISRINYCTNDESVGALQNAIIDAINKQIEDFVTQNHVSSNEIVKISFSANTTMLHLLSGINPTPIALAPYKAPFTESRKYTALQLGINAHPDAETTLLPSLSAYIGADIIAGLASLKPPAEINNYLFIDIGTNGEMAIVSNEKIYCCATAAGPALEGANISCGMGAFDGAISAYNEQGYQTMSDKKPLGICGSGLLDIIAYLLKKGFINTDGELKENFILATRKQSANGEDIIISPQDVREVQLAKSAIFTGIKLLMQRADLSYQDIDAIYLAGGFGNYMNPDSAIKIGLLPKECSEKIITVGNSSGAGAKLHVLSEDFLFYANDIIKKSELIELSNHPDFEMEFAMNMFFE